MPLKRLEKLNTTECLWVYILRILQDKDSHAYTLRKEIQKRYGFRPGTMTAYKVLYLLTREGFVKKKPVGRTKVYSITEKGMKSLRQAIGFYQERIRLLK